ncbi:MAG: geranylgeranylglycerol-phosphate geranylgeranyltransferase [Bacteroidales bacterium]|nr:geranylgeranylglycerol-phosphate geranylgeranyltransferase [Bacteroidales bacterium]
MVRSFKILFAFLRLIRTPNLIIIALTQYFIRWFILKPLLLVSDFRVQLSGMQFFLLVLSTMLIAAAGYIINDYFDRKTDLINRPGKVIVGRLISRRYAIIFHILFSAVGILLGMYLAKSINKLSLSVVFIFATGVLWFYSTTYKRQLLVGNLVISFLVGVVPLLVLIFEFPLLVNRYKLYILATGVNLHYLVFWIVSYAVFAFVINLIREIIKDMEDFEGDYIFGRQTVPIVWGINASKGIVISLIFLTIIPIFYLLVFHLSDKISFTYIILFIVVPLIIIAFGVFWASSKKQYYILSQLTKLVMLTGLLYCPLVNYIVSSYK